MAYVEGFVAAVSNDKREAYRAHSQQASVLFREFGATRMVDAWGDDVPDGKVTDFKGAVKAEPGETVVFGWAEYPDKATRDAANERLMNDPRMADMDMPFDGKRMIYGGFAPIVDETAGARGGYVDSFLVPVPDANREAYRDMAQKAAHLFQEYGATRVVEAWGDDVPDGKLTDYRMAVKGEPGETVVFSWIEWPSKADRDAAWPKLMADDRMKPPGEMPFNGQRMMWGGFETLVDA